MHAGYIDVRYKPYIFRVISIYSHSLILFIFLDPYVKVEVFDNTSRVFQETTNTKYKTLFPIFNERFQFELANEQKNLPAL